MGRMFRSCIAAIALFFAGGSQAVDIDLPKISQPNFSLMEGFKYHSGLYATITLGRCDYAPSPNSHPISIEVPQFAKPVHGRKIVMKEAGHELIIVLNGTGGLAEGGFASYVMHEYEKIGMSSLTFDSPFSDRFAESCGRGVPGNFRQDCYAMIDIINVFLMDSERRYGKNHYSKIGIVGQSMGAIDALLLPEVLNTLHHPPFRISGTIAICPPADMLEAAKILDEYGQLVTSIPSIEDVAFTFALEQARPDHDKFYDDDMMRYAMYRAFMHQFNDLKEIVFDRYQDDLLKVCPNQSMKAKFDHWKRIALPAVERRVYSDKIGFTSYFANICVPYWSHRRLEPGQLGYNAEQIRKDGNLKNLLSVKGGNAEVFICENCPLSRPSDIRDLKAGISHGDFSTPLYVLSCGGHCGIVQTKMIRERFPLIFESKGGILGFVMGN